MARLWNLAAWAVCSWATANASLLNPLLVLQEVDAVLCAPTNWLVPAGIQGLAVVPKSRFHGASLHSGQLIASA
jgi:hypothetical protein